MSDEITIKIKNVPGEIYLTTLCACRHFPEDEDGPCSSCGGIGLRPTDEGLAIIKLVQKYGHLTLEE